MKPLLYFILVFSPLYNIGQSLSIGVNYNLGRQGIAKYWSGSSPYRNWDIYPEKVLKNSFDLSMRIGKPYGINVIINNGFGFYKSNLKGSFQDNYSESDQSQSFVKYNNYEEEFQLKLNNYFYDITTNLSFSGNQKNQKHKFPLFFVVGLKYQQKIKSKTILDEGTWEASYLHVNDIGDTLNYYFRSGNYSFREIMQNDIRNTLYINLGGELRIAEKNNWGFSSTLIGSIPLYNYSLNYLEYRNFFSLQLSIYYQIPKKQENIIKQ